MTVYCCLNVHDGAVDFLKNNTNQVESCVFSFTNLMLFEVFQLNVIEYLSDEGQN